MTDEPEAAASPCRAFDLVAVQAALGSMKMFEIILGEQKNHYPTIIIAPPWRAFGHFLMVAQDVDSALEMLAVIERVANGESDQEELGDDVGTLTLLGPQKLARVWIDYGHENEAEIPLELLRELSKLWVQYLRCHEMAVGSSRELDT